MQLPYVYAVQSGRYQLLLVNAYQEHLLRSATEQLYSKFCLTLSNLTLNSHMQLVATMLNSAESIQEGEFIEHAFKYLCNVKLLWKFLNTYLQFFTYAIMD